MKIVESIDDKIAMLYGENEDRLAGSIAKELHVPVGQIGCPHCGITHNGALRKICSVCEQDMFETGNPAELFWST